VSSRGAGNGQDRRLTALPSVRARVLAFGAIVIAGGCGALIGSAFVSIQCRGNCATPTGLGAVAGGAFAAAGVAVVAILTLRAMGEWRRIADERLAGADGADADRAGGPAPESPTRRP
jgi:hypothetical protein